MKKCFAVLLLSILAAQGAHVRWYLPDSGGNNQTNKPLNLYPVGRPSTNGSGGIITRDRLRGYTDSNSVVTLSNVFYGDYRSEFTGGYTTTTNWYSFPDTNGLIYASDYITAPTNVLGGIAYTRQQAEARFIPKANGVATNLSIGAVGVTNAALYATNYSVVTTSDDTTVINVTTAGSTTARDHYLYLFTLADPRGAVYRGVTNGLFVINGDGDNDDGDVMIRSSTNNLANGSSLYIGLEPMPGTSWEALAGSNPTPGVSYGPLYTTNLFSQLQLSGVPLIAPTINNHLYLATNGSDLYWLRGQPERPFATFSAALAQLQAGDTLHIGPGLFSATSGDGVTKNGVVIEGSGRGVTLLGSPGTSGGLSILGNDCVLKDFTIGTSIIMGNGSGSIGATNLFIWAVDAQGTQDGLLLNTWASVQAWHSRFASPWDAYADFQYAIPSRQFYSNALAEFHYCEFISDDTFPGSFGPENIIMGSGTVRFFDCNIVRIGTNTTATSYISADSSTTGTTNGLMEFYNCVIANRGTVALSNTIHNAQGGKIRLYNTPLDFSKVYDPSNKIEVMTRDGGTLTNLNASNLSAGIVPSARYAGAGANSVKLASSAAANANDISIGNTADATGPGATAVGYGALADASQASSLGAGASSQHADSTAIGQNSLTTATNQVMIGKANGTAVHPGTTVATGNITNSALTASQFVSTDANKALTSTLNGGSLTGLNGNNLNGATNSQMVTITMPVNVNGVSYFTNTAAYTIFYIVKGTTITIGATTVSSFPTSQGTVISATTQAFWPMAPNDVVMVTNASITGAQSKRIP